MAEIERLSLAQKLSLLPKGYDATDPEISDEEYVEDGNYRAFALCRQINQRAEMLDLMFKNGQHESFSYSHLYRTKFDTEKGILLQFSDHLVKIEGRSLRDGYRRILHRRVLQITEADAPTMQLVGDKESVVIKISVEIFHPELVDH